MSVEPSTVREPGRGRPAEIVAGYLASLAIFASLVSLAWHPLRLSPVAMLMAVVATGMAGRDRRLVFAAMMISATCFFLGMTIAVLAERPLW
jgi:hypothetical protein